MGGKQFATGLTPEDKAQLSRIEDWSDNVGSDLDSANAAGTVHAKLKDVKKNLGGKEQTRYKVGSLVPVANTWYTLLDITGKGTLYEAILNPNSDVNDHYLRITIDGSIVFLAYTDATDFTGIFYKNSFVIHNGNTTTPFNLAYPLNDGRDYFMYEAIPIISSAQLVDLPYTGGGYNSKHIVEKGVFFGTSLKIEAMNKQGTAAIRYCYKVGVA